MPDASTLHAQALGAHRAGRYAVARRMLLRAQRSRPDADLNGRIELALAYVEAETGHPAAGLQRCQAALQLEGIGDVTRGLIWSQLGLLHMRTGESDTALSEFAQAITLLQAEPEHHGRALLNQGTLRLSAADPSGAARDLAMARDELIGAGAEIPAAKAEHNLGYARLLTGDLVGSLALMESAARVLAPLSDVSRAQGEQDRAEVLLAAGRPREAARALRAAADAYGQQRVRRFQAECEYVLARTLLREDPREARVVARRSARRFAAHGAPAWADRAEALAIAASIRTGVRAPSVLARADELEASLRDEGLDGEADQLALIATRLVLRRGDLDDAEQRLARVRLAKGAPIPLRLLRQEVRADLATARHQRAQARREITRGLTALHRWQSSFGSLDLQSTLVGHGRGLATRGLASALDDGRPALVYE
ncbi:MAG: hypothetical protein WAV00_11280, partial [Nocardioides sp.]